MTGKLPSTRGRLLDERSDLPVRRVIGDLLANAETADLAVGRIRLATLDLTEEEVRSARRCRVLLGQLDAATLLDTTAPSRPVGPATVAALGRLRAWLESERLQVRSAGIGAWTPDFSVFADRTGSETCLVGAHYFGMPHLTVGPSFTSVSQRAGDCSVLRRRFEELWHRGHDVAGAIADVLDRAAAEAGRLDERR